MARMAMPRIIGGVLATGAGLNYTCMFERF